jgi:hypothetical protein
MVRLLDLAQKALEEVRAHQYNPDEGLTAGQALAYHDYPEAHALG